MINNNQHGYITTIHYQPLLTTTINQDQSSPTIHVSPVVGLFNHLAGGTLAIFPRRGAAVAPSYQGPAVGCRLLVLVCGG